MKRILITGASGFVGAHLCAIAENKYQVHAMYHKNFLQNQPVIRHQFDLTQISKIFSFLDQVKPDVIIHTAATSSPDYCECHHEQATLINALATQELGSWAQQHQVRFIFTSSDMVFNGKNGLYRESDAPDPINYYGKTKVMAEESIAKAQGNWVIARVALVYGLGITNQRSFFEKMVHDLKQGQSVTLFYDQFRSPILVNNLAQALLELAENDFTGIIHLGGPERISRWEFGMAACQLLKLPSRLLIPTSMHDFSSLAARPRDVSLNCDLAQRILRTKRLKCDEGLEWIRITSKI